MSGWRLLQATPPAKSVPSSHPLHSASSDAKSRPARHPEGESHCLAVPSALPLNEVASRSSRSFGTGDAQPRRNTVVFPNIHLVGLASQGPRTPPDQGEGPPRAARAGGNDHDCASSGCGTGPEHGSIGNRLRLSLAGPAWRACAGHRERRAVCAGRKPELSRSGAARSDSRALPGGPDDSHPGRISLRQEQVGSSRSRSRRCAGAGATPWSGPP